MFLRGDWPLSCASWAVPLVASNSLYALCLAVSWLILPMQVEEKDGQFKAVGQPTEAALRVVADKLMGNHLSSDPTHAATKHFSPMYVLCLVLMSAEACCGSSVPAHISRIPRPTLGFAGCPSIPPHWAQPFATTLVPLLPSKPLECARLDCSEAWLASRRLT